MNNFVHFYIVFFVHSYININRKYNTLETEYEVLRDYVKENSFNKLIEKIGEPEKVKKLEEDNKRLRLKIKEYKELLKRKPGLVSKKCETYYR